MIKISPIRTIALATAITTGTACIAQNRLQNAYKEFLADEFIKADNNPNDLLLSQGELDAYMGNSDIRIKDFDTTSDGVLNIDEFVSIIEKDGQHPAPATRQDSFIQNPIVHSPVRQNSGLRNKVNLDSLNNYINRTNYQSPNLNQQNRDVINNNHNYRYNSWWLVYTYLYEKTNTINSKDDENFQIRKKTLRTETRSSNKKSRRTNRASRTSRTSRTSRANRANRTYRPQTRYKTYYTPPVYIRVR